jgi:hypothetical protein
MVQVLLNRLFESLELPEKFEKNGGHFIIHCNESLSRVPSLVKEASPFPRLHDIMPTTKRLMEG